MLCLLVTTLVNLYRIVAEEVAFEFKSEYVSQNLNPTWKPAYLDFSELCNGDLDAKFKIEVWDFDVASSPDMIGEVAALVIPQL